MEITVTLDDRRVQEGLLRFPDLISERVEIALARGAEELARVAKGKAPKLFSTLTNSIRAQRMGPMHYRVSTGVNYARAVEEGSGPAAGKPKYYPNPDSLRQYLMQAPSMRGHKWARAGSGKRGQQELDIWFRSRALAWYIYNHGTKPKPFMKPAVEETRDRIVTMVRESARLAAMEAFRG